MLARLECLLYLEDTKHADIKLAKLSAKILRKLARQAIMVNMSCLSTGMI